MEKQKTKGKLKPIHKEWIWKKMNEGEKSSNKIVEGLKNEFGVSVTAGYISHLRQVKNIKDTSFFDKSIEGKKMKKKAKIDVDMLDVAADIVKKSKEWFKHNGDKIKYYSPKEISMVMGQFHKFLKTYQEMMGSPVLTETSTTNLVQVWDKKFEQMSKENGS